MSESLQSNNIQTLPDDREELYLLVWREPAERITSLYSISKEQLTKRALNYGYRDRSPGTEALAKGTTPAVPALLSLKNSKVETVPRKTS